MNEVKGIKPLYNRIIVKRLDVKVRKSGIFIPDGAAGSIKASQGVVLAVGPNAVGIEVGQKILWGRYAGTEIETKGTSLLMMNDEDVLGILEEGYINGGEQS